MCGRSVDDVADEARALDGVHAVTVQTAVGETLHVVESSWDRPGRVVVVAEDGPAAQRLADHAAALVRIEVEPGIAGHRGDEDALSRT